MEKEKYTPYIAEVTEHSIFVSNQGKRSIPIHLEYLLAPISTPYIAEVTEHSITKKIQYTIKNA
jgi:hypothetical protein